MNYYHQFIDGSRSIFPVGKVVCVGRNYASHVKELNNPIPAEPLLFMKPATALKPISEPISLPSYSQDCQYEIEIAILIGNKLARASISEAVKAIAGYGLALDLTLRDIQQQLKQQGYPWERAKAFDGSCPIAPFVKLDNTVNLQAIEFSLQIDEVVKQHGNSRDMLWPIAELLSHISHYFSLTPGDIVLTGTPAGVGRLQVGDKLRLELSSRYTFTTHIMS
jgi:acylpyruvate hydrolase